MSDAHLAGAVVPEGPEPETTRAEPEMTATEPETLALARQLSPEEEQEFHRTGLIPDVAR